MLTLLRKRVAEWQGGVVTALPIIFFTFLFIRKSEGVWGLGAGSGMSRYTGVQGFEFFLQKMAKTTGCLTLYMMCKRYEREKEG